MSQQSPSVKSASTWGKFSTRQAANATQKKLQEAGIAPEKITVETENFESPVKLENTQAIANLKVGAIAGGVMGLAIGLSIVSIITNFFTIGLAALKNFQAIHYLAPIFGAIIGAVGMSLILGISGASVPKNGTDLNNRTEAKRYLVVVEGTAEEISLVREIVTQQGGVVEEADRR